MTSTLDPRKQLPGAARQRQRHEFPAQMLRILGAAVLTAAGLVPEGNTGGGKCERLQTPPRPARTASDHYIGALGVNRHSYLKLKRGDQHAPRFTNRYQASTGNVWVSFRVTRKVTPR